MPYIRAYRRFVQIRPELVTDTAADGHGFARAYPLGHRAERWSLCLLHVFFTVVVRGIGNPIYRIFRRCVMKGLAVYAGIRGSSDFCMVLGDCILNLVSTILDAAARPGTGNGRAG